MVEENKHEKGSLGWFRDQAKKDGFENIRDWQNWIIDRQKKREEKSNKSDIKNKILDLIRQFYEDNGRTPTMRDFNADPKYPSSSKVQNYFGRWNNAIRCAGLQTNSFVGLTNEELLEYLRKFEKENGRPPTEYDLTHNDNYPSVGPYITHFGSLEKAKKLVGQDIDSTIRKGIIETNRQKARLAEIIVLEHFAKKRAIDVSGKIYHSPIDGICPNNQIYDVKSSGLIDDIYWQFIINKGGGVDFYYLLAFNKDWTKLLHVWRIPWNFIDGNSITIGISGYHRDGYNVENMKKYDTSERFTDISKILINRIQKLD